MLFGGVSAQTYISTWKRLSDSSKIWTTSSYLKIIKCNPAIKCRQDSHVNVYNFVQKSQAVAEKTANNFRGLLFCRTWYRMDERSTGANSAGATWNSAPEYSPRNSDKHHVLPRYLSVVYFDFSEMTYNVLMGTLNPTYSLTHSLTHSIDWCLTALSAQKAISCRSSMKYVV